MKRSRWSVPVRRAAFVILVLLAPPVRHALEATMTAQMLVQLPLLVVAGWLLSRAFPPRERSHPATTKSGSWTSICAVMVASRAWRTGGANNTRMTNAARRTGTDHRLLFTG